MLDAYMIKNGKFVKILEQINISEVMRAIYDMFKFQMNMKQIDFKIIIKKQVPKIVKSDKRRMMQVIINLTQNALKFTSKGSIIINVDFVRLAVDYLEFSVKDTGIGIRRID